MLSVNPLTAVLYFWVCIILKVKDHKKKKSRNIDIQGFLDD